MAILYQRKASSFSRTPDIVACVLILLLCLAGLHAPAHAQDAVIRKNLQERLEGLPAIDEISKTPVPGIFEVRINKTEIFYVDEKADFLFEGSLMDLRSKENLTASRVAKLSVINFKDLPLKDSFVIKRGSGKRKLAVFADPNCGYCKELEKELQKISDVSVHVFLYPVLGADSSEKAARIWCSKNKAASFEAYMLNQKAPESAKCDTSSVDRNVAFGKKQSITGTPTIVFPDGERVGGLIDADEINKRLSRTVAKK
jgi:thiol:disulfide interchange protein DsbC